MTDATGPEWGSSSAGDTPAEGVRPERDDSPGAGTLQYHRFVFSGSAGEYFRIWIVNVFLTVITVGIYASWAKVRTRRYLYNNTSLAGDPFEYLGDPRSILKGNLIIGGGLIAYVLSRAFSPVLVGALFLLFYVVMPYLVYTSLRFNARNSAFRNIRFRFRGTLRESYKVYLLFPILVGVTGGILVPYWAFRRKQYFLGNLCFGGTAVSFSGTAGPFYKVYVRVGVVLALVFVAGSFLVGALGGVFRGMGSGPAGQFRLDLILFPALLIGGYGAAMVLAQQYLYARLSNYSFDHTTLGQVRFVSSLRARRLAFIQVTNLLAIISTAGLAFPWAKIRRTRYILENLQVLTDRGLDQFVAASDEDVTALGETATDFFDIDMGL